MFVDSPSMESADEWQRAAVRVGFGLLEIRDLLYLRTPAGGA